MEGPSPLVWSPRRLNGRKHMNAINTAVDRLEFKKPAVSAPENVRI